MMFINISFIHIIRILSTLKTKRDVDDIIKTMSETDKKYLAIEGSSYLSILQGKSVVKRFLKKVDNTPISFLDLLKDNNNINIVVGTRSGTLYRGKGHATSIAKKAKEYLDSHSNDFDKAIWGVNKNNKYSISIAEKMGFKYEPESEGDNGFVNYVYEPKSKNLF